MKLGHAIANFFSGFWNNDLEPWLKALVDEIRHDVVTDIMPIIADAASELGVDLLGSGTSISEKAAVAGQIIAAAAKKIEQSGVDIAVHDITTGVAGLLAQVSATAKASAALPKP